ncbi:hypothetical protein CcaCcLH18_03975 [Colletotrichum camelliae]|nr:hypothetical protein CcaCcLH18_03975 [Colletotrichum camelliae]
MSSSPLFRLPRELRDIIYSFYVIVDGGYICDTDGFTRGKLKGADNREVDLSLVYSCKRIADEMDRGGLALRLNTITFSTLESVGFSHLACQFQQLKSRGVDFVRCEIFQTYGHLIPDSVYAEAQRKYPQFMPLLDRMRAEGPRTPAQDSGLCLERHGPYGEAPSVYRGFITDVLQAAWTQSESFRKLVADFSPPMSETGHIDRWSPFDVVKGHIDPWAIPSDSQMDALEAAVPIEFSCPKTRRDRSIYRFSAAAAAIYFLQSIPHSLRKHLRKIILNEDHEAVLYPHEHARGLIPFCQQYPIQVERRVSLWNVVFQEDMFYRHPDERCWRDKFETRRTPCVMNSDQITANIATWIIEALALDQEGMPPGSFSLLLNGDPCPDLCSRIFDSIVQRDAAWQQAWTEAIERGILGQITWFEIRGESVLRHGWFDFPQIERASRSRAPANRPGYWGYIFEQFPQSLTDIAGGRSIVHCNFDMGAPRDAEAILRKHLGWNKQKWEREWFNHTPQSWGPEPPLPQWRMLLEDNLWDHNPYGCLCPVTFEYA